MHLQALSFIDHKLKRFHDPFKKNRKYSYYVIYFIIIIILIILHSQTC